MPPRHSASEESARQTECGCASSEAKSPLANTPEPLADTLLEQEEAQPRTLESTPEGPGASTAWFDLRVGSCQIVRARECPKGWRSMTGVRRDGWRHALGRWRGRKTSRGVLESTLPRGGKDAFEACSSRASREVGNFFCVLGRTRSAHSKASTQHSWRSWCRRRVAVRSSDKSATFRWRHRTRLRRRSVPREWSLCTVQQDDADTSNEAASLYWSILSREASCDEGRNRSRRAGRSAATTGHALARAAATTMTRALMCLE